MSAKPLLVGESNPYGADPQYALYPLPERASGHRLCTQVLGLRPREYMEAFDRVNLCEGRWSIKAARGRAFDLMMGPTVDQVLVLLGSKVCSAFELDFSPFTSLSIPKLEGKRTTFVILPHPSGLNRMWNEVGAYAKARAALASAVPSLKELWVSAGVMAP